MFAAAGFLSGAVSGFFGIGGGFIRVPLFLLLFPYFGVHGELVMHVAVATSLALGIPSGITSLRQKMASGTFDGPYFRQWVIGLCLGTLIGAILFPYMPALVMKILYVIVLFVFAFYFGLVSDDVVLRSAPPSGLTRLCISGGISSYVVMTGVGGGSANTFVMKACAMPLQQALAIGTASALVINALGSAGCMVMGWGQPELPPWSFGFVDGMVFLAMVPGIVLASTWGAKASLRMDRKRLKKSYGGFLLLIAAYMTFNLAMGQ